MGLIARIRYRIGVWRFRVRYWWLDTPAGRHAQVMSVCMLAIATIVGLVRESIRAFMPQPIGAPHQAIVWIVVWLIVALIAGLAIALTANSKPAKPQDQQAKAPTTQDGRAAVRYYGTCNIEDPAQLAWKVVGKDPIQQSGGK